MDGNKDQQADTTDRPIPISISPSSSSSSTGESLSSFSLRQRKPLLPNQRQSNAQENAIQVSQDSNKHQQDRTTIVASPVGSHLADTFNSSSSNPSTPITHTTHATGSHLANAPTPPAPRRHRPPLPVGDAMPEFILLFLFIFLLLGGTMMFFLSDQLVSVDHSHRRMGGMTTRDTEFKLMVSLESIYTGGTVQSDFPHGRQIRCQHCHGHGGHDVRECSTCDGTGREHFRRQVGPGFWQSFSQTCRKCGGHGKQIGRLCPFCRGEGVTRDTRTPLSITIPRGIPDGYTLHLRNVGHQFGDSSIPAGDVYVTIVGSGPSMHRFKREGQHLWLHHTITLRQALGGFKFEFQHLDGRHIEIVRDGVTQPDDVHIIGGEGMPEFDSRTDLTVNGKEESTITRIRRSLSSWWHPSPNPTILQRGDLHIQFHVDFPKRHTFTEKEKEELHRLLPPH